MTHHTPDVPAIARQIAAALPDGWQTFDSPHGAYSARITGPDGAHVWMRHDHGRLVVTAGTPDQTSYSDGDTRDVTIVRATYAADRAPDAIARDMARRVLPGAWDMWQTVAARIERRTTAAATRDALASELAAIMGSRTYSRGDGEARADMPDRLAGRPGVRGIYGHMAPDYDGQTVTVELRGLSADHARALARIIADMPDPVAD